MKLVKLPIILKYNDALMAGAPPATGRRANDKPRMMNGGNGGTEFISGTYRVVGSDIPEDAILDVGVQFHYMPDFCGGGLVSSAYSTYNPDPWNDWGSGLNRREGASKHAAKGLLKVSVDEMDATFGTQDPEEYGYCLLANALASWMLREGKMQVIGSDQEDEYGGIQALACAFERTTFACSSFARPKLGYLDVQNCAWQSRLSQEACGVVCYVAKHGTYLNPNSGHWVQWMKFSIDSTNFWEHEEDEFGYTDVNDEYGNTLLEEVQRAMDGSMKVAEDEYLTGGTASAFARRDVWRMG